MRQLWAPWRMAYVTGAESNQRGCFLCEAARTGLENPHVVERAELTVTILNRFPYSPGHLMIAPLRHVADPADLNDGEGSAIFAALQRALQTLRATMQPDGFNAGLNLGLVAGGSIEHLHFHVVPRWDGDTNFMPVIGDIKVLPEHLDATAKRLREAYSGLGGV